MFRISRPAPGSSHILPFFPFLLETDYINYSHPAGRSCAARSGIPFFSISPHPAPSETPGKSSRVLPVSAHVPATIRPWYGPVRGKNPSRSPPGILRSRSRLGLWKGCPLEKHPDPSFRIPGCRACIGRESFPALSLSEGAGREAMAENPPRAPVLWQCTCRAVHIG